MTKKTRLPILMPRPPKANQPLRLQSEQLEPRIVLDASMNPVLTVNTNFGSFQIELLWQESPIAVDNFLNYVNDGDYNNSIFHRLADIASSNDEGNNGIDILQGGGFTSFDEFFSSLSQIGIVPVADPITGEPGILNERGTVALAQSSGPNSATSQFYVNVQDNPFLTQFTVFARISDMTLIDQFAQFNVSDETPAPGSGIDPRIEVAFGELPLSDDGNLIVIQSIEGDGMILGTKYDDLDRDGMRDDDEPGMAGFTIYLDINSNGELDDEDIATTTDENGDYCFQVEPGSYIVRELPADNRDVTEPDEGFYEVEVGIGRVLAGLDFGSSNQTNQPTLDVVADGEAQQLATYELLATILDDDFVDIHDLEIDWGDGNVDRQVVTPANSSHGTAGDLTIRVDYSRDTSNFFNTQVKRDVMQAAADILAALFADELTAIVPGDGNTFDITFNNPSNGDETTVLNFTVQDNEIVVFVGGRDLGSTGEDDVSADLLGIGGPGGFNVSGEQTFVDNARERGQAGAATDADPKTDFGPWGGSIAFNSATNWHFGLTREGLDADEIDFLSVALHELAHVFGVGSAKSWAAQIDGILDLFNGAQVAAEIDNGADPAVTGDGNHFAEGLMDEGREAALDPTLSAGIRKLLSNLDIAALGDIGWDTGSLSASGGEVNASHIYTSTGLFTITVQVTDSDGNVATQAIDVNVGDAVIGTGDPELLIVTTLEDVVAIDGLVSLREAILATNANGTVSDAVAGPSTATIQFDPALFDTPGTIELTGGELRITDSISIIGPGSLLLTVDAGYDSRGFRIKDGTTTVLDVAISGMTIQAGKQPDAGGAIFNQESLTLDDVRLLDSDHGSLPGVTRGGAIYTSGNLTIGNSTIAGNSAMLGGGIFVDSGAIVDISNTTISGNEATRFGGGIYVSNGSVTLTNSTISGNMATLDGGGIYQSSVGMTLINVTVAFNEADRGGGIYSDFGTVALTNTIISNNMATTSSPDAKGTFGGNNNILQDTAGATLSGDDNQTGVDPKLSELGDFGGPTLTHFLLAGSSAIDTGTALGAPLLDQRGEARPLDGDGLGLTAHDIGAVEVSAFAVGDSYSLVQGGMLDVPVGQGVLANDVLPAGDAHVVEHPLTGDLVLHANGSFTYLPPPDFFGEVSFTYQSGEGAGASNVATVSITIAESQPPLISLGGSQGEESESETQEFIWEVTDPDNAIFSVEVVVKQDGETVFESETTSGNFNFDELGPGQFTMEVVARDVTNKSSTASRSVTVVAEPVLELQLLESNDNREDLPEPDTSQITLLVETPEPNGNTESSGEKSSVQSEIEEEGENEWNSYPREDEQQDDEHYKEHISEKSEGDCGDEELPTTEETQQQAIFEDTPTELFPLFAPRSAEALELFAPEEPLIEPVVILGESAGQLPTPEPLTGSGGDVSITTGSQQAEADETRDENVLPASGEEPLDEQPLDEAALLDRAFEQDLMLDFCGWAISNDTARFDHAVTAVVAPPVAGELVELSGHILLAVPIEEPDAHEADRTQLLDERLPELNPMRLVGSSATMLGTLAAMTVGHGVSRTRSKRRYRSHGIC